MIRGLREDHRAVLVALSAFEAVAQQRLGSEMPAPLAQGANGATLAAAHRHSADALAVAREAVGQVRRAVGSAEAAGSLAGDTLAAAHAKQDAAYDAIVRKYDVDRTRIAERDRLRAQFLDLEAAQKRLDERRREHDARTAERRTLLDARARAVAGRFAVRRRVAREISVTLEREIEIDLVAGADIVDYAALLVELTKGQNIRPPALLRAIATHIRPADLAALVLANDARPLAALDDSATSKAERAQRILDALRASGRVRELETTPLGDVPTIKLKVGDEHVPSSQLSTGQRCTAILPILLIQSAAPLIIDQPEDQVDNAYIFRVLVKTLLKVKKSRQIIFATHNPNILVLAESDRVFALAASNRKGRVKQFGTLDELRETIEEHVEGGREAFLLRSKRYGHS